MARRLSNSERPAEAPNDSLDGLVASRGGFAGGGEVVEGPAIVSYGWGDSDVERWGE